MCLDVHPPASSHDPAIGTVIAFTRMSTRSLRLLPGVRGRCVGDGVGTRGLSGRLAVPVSRVAEFLRGLVGLAGGDAQPALREYERHHNDRRPHRGIANARPRAPLPEPITDPDRLVHLNIHRRDRLSGLLHEYDHAA